YDNRGKAADDRANDLENYLESEIGKDLVRLSGMGYRKVKTSGDSRKVGRLEFGNSVKGISRSSGSLGANSSDLNKREHVLENEFKGYDIANLVIEEVASLESINQVKDKKHGITGYNYC
ncbi:32136_t:CDS:2, partial [Gigaspora margarita]